MLSVQKYLCMDISIIDIIQKSNKEDNSFTEFAAAAAGAKLLQCVQLCATPWTAAHAVLNIEQTKGH